MLSDITWEAYLAGAGTLLGIYYLVLGLVHFRQAGWRWPGRRFSAGPVTAPQENEAEENERVLSYEELAQVASQVRRCILEEAGNDAGKPELLERLRSVLANHGGLRAPASKDALAYYIKRYAQEIGGIQLEKEDLERVWGTLSRS